VIHRSRRQLPLICVLLAMVGCTAQPLSSSGPASSGAAASQGGLVASGRTTVELPGSTQNIVLTEPALAQDQLDSLKDLSAIPSELTIGRPVEVVVTGILPSGGAVLTRTYHSALPDGAAATFAFYDEELGAWHAVPSTLSADRTSLSATVHHLSLWTDIVSGSWASLKNASEWAFDQIGKIVDVRVDAPRCVSGAPSWLASANFIQDGNANPVRFCTGKDPKLSDVVVLQARVNRGYAYTAHLATSPTWAWNSTEATTGELQAIYSILANVDRKVAQSVTDLLAGGILIGPGEELKVAISEGAARKIAAGQPILVLRPMHTWGFVASELSRLIANEILSRGQSFAAAAVAVASCVDDFAHIQDVGTALKAGGSCISHLDVRIASRVGLLLQNFKNPKTGAIFTAKEAGRLAGKLVGLITVTIALAFPVLTYWQDRRLPDEARSVTLFPKALPKFLPSIDATMDTAIRVRALLAQTGKISPQIPIVYGCESVSVLGADLSSGDADLIQFDGLCNGDPVATWWKIRGSKVVDTGWGSMDAEVGDVAGLKAFTDLYEGRKPADFYFDPSEETWGLVPGTS
jgi:hypothetical protein